MNDALDEWIETFRRFQCPAASMAGLRCDKPLGHDGHHEATTKVTW